MAGIMAANAYSGSSDIRKPKRAKIDVACDSCRTRKVKCNGSRPVCGECARRKGQAEKCHYSGDVVAKSLPLIARPEIGNTLFTNGRYASATPPFPQTPVSTTLFPTSPDNGSNQHIQFASTSMYSNSHTVDSRESHVAYAAGDFDHTVDSVEGHDPGGINSMACLARSDDSGFFGTECSRTLIQQLKSAVNTQIPRATHSPSQSRSNHFLANQAPAAGNGVRARFDYILPSRRVADNLVATYWELVHPLYPFLDEETFEKAFTSIWLGDSPGPDERIFVSTLNAMFALASQLSDSIDPEERAATAATFFTRAQDLLHVDLWTVGSIQTVQCLLLMGQYLQSTNNTDQCWMVISHAVRIAHGLKLHLPQSSAYVNCPIKGRELARRVWHACVLMDRIVLMTSGKPAMIAVSDASAIPLPQTMDAEYASPQSVSQHNEWNSRPSKLMFYIKSLQLYEIIGQILLSLYKTPSTEIDTDTNHRVNALEPSDMSTVLKIDRDLMLCGRSLPSYLRISSPDAHSNDLFQREAVIFRASFLYARILLLRPVLSRFCLPQSESMYEATILDDSVGQRMSFECSALCLSAAHDLISLIYMHYRPGGKVGMLPEWWYCVFYLYTSASILLTSRLRPALEHSSPPYSIAESWSCAMDILKALRWHGDSARRCVAALEILSATIPCSSEVDHQAGAQNTQSQSTFHESNTAEHEHNILPQNSNFPTIMFDLNDMSWLSYIP